MEKEKLNKKQIIPLVIGVLTMIILVLSATYAYFKVSIGNTATSTTITGDIGGGTLGTITLDGGGTNLYLGVSAYDMSENKIGTIYYSSTIEGSRETNVNNAEKATYTATLSGDDTDSVMYACDYEFTVTSSGTALGKESINDIELVFNGDIEKIVNLTGSDKVSGTWFGFKNSNKDRSFNAYLQLENKDSEQNSLAGTNLSVEIKNTKWNCYLSESLVEPLPGEAYAIVTREIDENYENCEYVWDDELGEDICVRSTLTFVRSETPYNVGGTYNNVEITAVYTGFEEESYSFDEVPWANSGIIKVIVEDEIRPISTANWFVSTRGIHDLTNLNTSLVTDMSGMFSGNLGSESTHTIYGLENWDVSNVTNMSWMFGNSDGWDNTVTGVENWDVSNVTNMSGMFYNATVNSSLLNWDVSNVTDMSSMFSAFGGRQSLNLSGWDVSNVTDMSNMFYQQDEWASGSGTINLTGWNISSEANTTNMFGTASSEWSFEIIGLES